jgi:hypothetical protein
MTWFQTTYTVRHNARRRLKGHLFGGRYKAVLVEPDESEYFRTLLDSIHLNPVRAGLVQVNLKGGGLPYVAGFPWSSLPHFQERPSLRPAFLVTSQGFGAFDFKDGIRDRRRDPRSRRAAGRADPARRIGGFRPSGEYSGVHGKERG